MMVNSQHLGNQRMCCLCLKKEIKKDTPGNGGTTDIQTCPIKLQRLFRAPVKHRQIITLNQLKEKLNRSTSKATDDKSSIKQ